MVLVKYSSSWLLGGYEVFNVDLSAVGSCWLNGIQSILVVCIIRLSVGRRARGFEFANGRQNVFGTELVRPWSVLVACFTHISPH